MIYKSYVITVITLYMCMILYTLCTVVFHSNGQYIMLPAHCKVKTVDQG